MPKKIKTKVFKQENIYISISLVIGNNKMGWFNKKKEEEIEELPELPELPSENNLNLPSIDSYSKYPESPPGLPDLEVNTLPSLPNFKSGNQANQNAIKIALNKKKPELPNFPKPVQTEKYETPRTIELSESPSTFSQRQFSKQTKKIEPIYVRLDKFENSAQTFEEIKTKIEEIESLLKKIKEIKSQEEKELEEWEHEIQVIKARIESVDRDIFNKLD